MAVRLPLCRVCDGLWHDLLACGRRGDVSVRILGMPWGRMPGGSAFTWLVPSLEEVVPRFVAAIGSRKLLTLRDKLHFPNVSSALLLQLDRDFLRLHLWMSLCVTSVSTLVAAHLLLLARCSTSSEPCYIDRRTVGSSPSRGSAASGPDTSGDEPIYVPSRA
jgi:hypothetical protein